MIFKYNFIFFFHIFRGNEVKFSFFILLFGPGTRFSKSPNSLTGSFGLRYGIQNRNELVRVLEPTPRFFKL